MHMHKHKEVELLYSNICKLQYTKLALSVFLYCLTFENKLYSCHQQYSFNWVATVSKGAELTFPGGDNSFMVVACALAELGRCIEPTRYFCIQVHS